ncbi:MAG: caspase family protein [Planctomycetaceae bacterium]
MRHVSIAACAALSLLLLTGKTVAEPKVYALFAIDTDLVGYDSDGNESDSATEILRSAARRNRDMMLAAFVQSFNQEGRRHRLEYKVLEGSQVTWKNIHGYWETVESDEDDTFVFYYFGHGAVDSDLGHYFSLTHAAESGAFGGAPCYRCYLRAAMQSKPNRLCVLLTDCCSSYIDGTAGLTRVAEGANWEVMGQLMFGPTGLVDVTAAQLGTVARASSGGGFFTESLVTYLCGPLEEAEVEVDGDVSWGEFLGSVRWRVENVHKQPQSHHNFYLNEWGKYYRERELHVVNDSAHDIQLYVNYYAYHSTNEEWDWFGSTFYDTGRPVENTKSWTISAGTSTRLRDGDDLHRPWRHLRLLRSGSRGIWSGRSGSRTVYGDHGYITDDGEIGRTTSASSETFSSSSSPARPGHQVGSTGCYARRASEPG